MSKNYSIIPKIVLYQKHKREKILYYIVKESLITSNVFVKMGDFISQLVKEKHHGKNHLHAQWYFEYILKAIFS